MRVDQGFMNFFSYKTFNALAAENFDILDHFVVKKIYIQRRKKTKKRTAKEQKISERSLFN